MDTWGIWILDLGFWIWDLDEILLTLVGEVVSENKSRIGTYLGTLLAITRVGTTRYFTCYYWSR